MSWAIQSKVLAFAFGLSAEIERNLIAQRTKEAMAKLRIQGIKLGRPCGQKNTCHIIDGHEDLILDMYSAGLSKRKQIQEKLIKFATRVPIFMYLTDYRERTLKDVITQLEPGLFKKVTGLDVKDFELLVSLGVFNDALMNDAVYKFKRYEDASLEYSGINKHEGEGVGLFDTVLSHEDYEMM